jgi:hypothetical protein
MLSIGKLGKGQERYYLDYADPCVMPTSPRKPALQAGNETMESA